MDPIEKRIDALREQFEQVEQPDRDAIWQRIQRPLPLQASRPRWHWLAAACVLLLVGIGIGLWWPQRPPASGEAAFLAGLPPEWQQQIRQYQDQARHKELVLQTYSSKGTPVPGDIHELQVLDSLQQVFWDDFRALPKDEHTAQLYLRYYEQKIRILELVLKEIQIHEHEKERTAEWQI
ncbi:MAG: hypothetical protein IT262_21310 [Saprospiraceae bacterium]|nr:hypothetical protein [Saprospiraceae bacterium]